MSDIAISKMFAALKEMAGGFSVKKCKESGKEFGGDHFEPRALRDDKAASLARNLLAKDGLSA